MSAGFQIVLPFFLWRVLPKYEKATVAIFRFATAPAYGVSVQNDKLSDPYKIKVFGIRQTNRNMIELPIADDFCFRMC